jgi:hypothetical protein
MKRHLIFVFSLITAAAMPALADEVTVTGCAAAGVEANCIVIKDGDKTYDITTAQPAPFPGTYGRVKGMLSDKVSACHQGQVIDPATWEVETGKPCPIETSQ